MTIYLQTGYLNHNNKYVKKKFPERKEISSMFTLVEMKTTIFILSVFILVFKQCQAQADEGDNCVLKPDGSTGKCVLLDNCQYAKDLLKNRRIPQTCGFVGNWPIVCCKKSEKTPGQISREKCKFYQDDLKTISTTSVFGGQKAKPRVYKHMAALGYQVPGSRNEIAWNCGGSLISENFVLTAAHCVESKDVGPVKMVRLGELDFDNSTEDKPPIDSDVVQVFVHPQYRPPSHYNDIALLKLKKNISATVSVKTACLNVDNDLDTDKKYIITGWGKVEFAGDKSNHLLEAFIDLIPNKKCRQKYSSVSRRRLPSGILDKSQICAGDPVGTDTCPGDSGGPLQEQIEADELQQHHKIIGITSFGKGCGVQDSVGVYTRVSDYLEWIEDIVWPSG